MYPIVILAGGKSSRMGTDKSVIKLSDKSALEQIVEVANHLTDEVIVVSNSHEKHKHLHAELVSDLRVGMGPLAGIESALLATSTEKNIVIACDMPFVNGEMIEKLANLTTENFDSIIPVVNGQHHPLFAIYSKSTLPILQETLDNGDSKIRIYLDKINTKWLTDVFDEENEFYNMNTPEDLAFVKEKFDERTRT